MNDKLRLHGWTREEPASALLTREWLVTNGVGGYASGTLSGIPSRRYHAYLIAAFASPMGRVVMLNHLEEEVYVHGEGEPRIVSLNAAPDVVEDVSGADRSDAGAVHLEEFLLEEGLPIWRFRIGAIVLEKRVLLLHEQNTVYVGYRIVEGEANIRMRVRPWLHPRFHEASCSPVRPDGVGIGGGPDRWEIATGSGFPVMRVRIDNADGNLVREDEGFRTMTYALEKARGYPSEEQAWTPGTFEWTLRPGAITALVASTEDWSSSNALGHHAWDAELERRRRLLTHARPEAREGLGAHLVLAADQFIISPLSRKEDVARAHAVGEEIRTVIAGYHWFTDWGRDTMISLEGLTLVTGRHREAEAILRTFASYVRDGLIPNLFPEGNQEGLYHTADASLWFFHAVDRYLATTGDYETLEAILPRLVEIADRHLSGTRFGIGVDKSDGLLRQGAPGYQLTWMDAKVDDWVVTPRRGKAVEINALFYNALSLLSGWLRTSKGAAAAALYEEVAQQTRASFNRRFWFEGGQHLFDVVDGEQGDDPALRPNQIFSLSLRYPVLEERYWTRVLDSTTTALLTPVGLRSLSPGHPDYKRTYDGDLRSRDAAYHQGTVWAWLLGPYIDAFLRVHPTRREHARELVLGFGPHLADACIGSIAEIFDAEPPFLPRGCIAQAWSVAEVLRCWVKTAPPEGKHTGDQRPNP